MTDFRRPVGPIEPEVLPADGERVVTWRTPEGWTVTVPVAPPPPPPPPRARWRLPILLFIATCLSTLLTGGPIYAAAIMSILLAHEMGHYLQARRYGVPASPPYFIPLPLPNSFGTLGAVILMRPRSTTLKRLYDVAISGPLAGLGPALAASAIGLFYSGTEPYEPSEGLTMRFNAPLIFRWMIEWLIEVPEGHIVILHPLAFAGWVGIFITALNLLPIGQLDGGHILYALAPRHAPRIFLALVAFTAVMIVWNGWWHWSLMYLLILIFGLRHPPVRHDSEPLDLGRQILGWATLSFLVLGFTPVPFVFE